MGRATQAKLLLLITLAGAVGGAGRAAAQGTCPPAGPSTPARFGAAYLPGEAKTITGTSAGGAPPTVTRTFCWSITPLAVQAAACASDCCKDGAKLTAVVLPSVGASCAGDSADKALRKAAWKLGGTRVTAKFSKPGTLRLTVPQRAPAISAPTPLCVTLTESRGQGASCKTAQDVCGSAVNCQIQLEVSGAGAPSAKAACCALSTVVPFDTSTPCPAGTGGANCVQCAAGSWSAGGTAADPRPACAACAAGTTTLRPGATSDAMCRAPGSGCAAGYGGAGCAACTRGTFSTGGTNEAPFAACTACPSGTTTKYGKTAATSAADCSVSICPPGTGGPSCTRCAYGTYSPGGDAVVNAQPQCQKCANNGYTATMGATSSDSCYRSGPLGCAKGYILLKGACNLCPPDTWSPGGKAALCNNCPGGSTTNGVWGAGSEDACIVPPSLPDGSFTWTSLANDVMSQSCRQDVATLLSGASWDLALAAKLRLAQPGSCLAFPEGVEELRAFFVSGAVAGKANALLTPGTDGSLAPAWQAALAVPDYESCFAAKKAGFPAITSWTPVANLEALYQANKALLSQGPVTVALAGASPAAQADALAAVGEALELRKATANTYWGGKLSPAAAFAWLAVRHAAQALEDVVPGIPSAAQRAAADALPPEAKKWVTADPDTILKAAKAAGAPVGRLSSSLISLGIREVSLYDSKTQYRYLICGTGLNEDGTRSSNQAVQAFVLNTDCLTSGPVTGQLNSTVITTFKDSKSLTKSMKFGLELRASVFGSNIGAGLKFLMTSAANSNAVYSTAMATKMEAEPTDLPTTFPPLTDLAKAYLVSHGWTGFKKQFGSHFIYKFRLGGYLSFLTSYTANQVMSKLEVSAFLDVKNKNTSTVTDFNAQVSVKNSLSAKSVSVTNQVSTNVYLPEYACGALVLDQNYNASLTQACINEWFQYPPQAAYSAYAMPWQLHPDLIALNIPQTDSGDSIPTSQPTDQLDVAGTLQTRLTSIQRLTDAYPEKGDRWYKDLYTAIDDAKTTVQSLLDGLRTGSMADNVVESTLNSAIALTEVAEAASVYVPAGSLCGWCTSYLTDDRMPDCETRCSSALNCELSCPTGSTDYVSCATKGFTYDLVADEDGNLNAECKAAVTAPICTAFGALGTPGGKFHCKQTICDWSTQFCEGTVEQNYQGVWGCLGTCRARNTTFGVANTSPCSATFTTNFTRGAFTGIGGFAVSEVYYDHYDNGTNTTAVAKPYWTTLSELADTFPDLPLWADFYESRATPDFFTTNCPAVKEVYLWDPSRAADGATFPGAGGDGVTSVQPLVCMCWRTKKWFVDSIMFTPT